MEQANYNPEEAQENRISSGLKEDPFYSTENMHELERRVNDVRPGRSTMKEHDLIDED